MNPDEERVSTSKPFQKLSDTQWLVRSTVLSNLLQNWHELLAYFETATLMHGFNSHLKANTI